MKKNLAKRIVLGLLTGAVLMSSSVAWAEVEYGYKIDLNEKYLTEHIPDDSLSIGGYMSERVTNGEDVTEQGSVRSVAIGVGSQVGSIVNNVRNDCPDSVALGYYAGVDGTGGTAIGSKAKANGENSVALGYGSIASEENVVSVGYGTTLNGVGVAYRRIVNVAEGNDTYDAVNVGQLQEVKDIVGTGEVVTNGSGITCITNGETLTDTVRNLANAVHTNWDGLYAKTGSADFSGGIYSERVRNASDLTDAVNKLDTALGKVYTKTEADAKFVKIGENNVINNSITINENSSENPVTIGSEGITVGTNSARIDGSGFYVWGQGDTSNHNKAQAIASMTEEGKIKGAGGKFEVGTDGSVKAADGAFTVAANGNVTGGTYNGVDIQALANSVASNDAVAGINQRLEKTNAKINKVGAGAAALAALHPLDYDPDDKLTFSAGMGNYAGENAAALGAFYRPNEKFMLSLGGTMGNGENMVNLGLSIGLDKASGFAKMSKRELIQEVNAVKAENEAMKDQLANADERIAKLEALVAQLVAK
ncbi:MAG: YadA-like family protein [Phascolarctobacterium sp.]|nr:YadA-like family protein [Phascolarctobacterium sp.]